VAKTANTKQKSKDSPGTEQREYPRLKPSSVPFLKSISFEKGLEAQVIEISRGGMLIETDVRLRPQMKLGIKVATLDGTIMLDGSIVRTFIVSLKGVPRYQSAINFDHPFRMLDDWCEKTVEEAANGLPEPIPAPEVLQEAVQPPAPAKSAESAEDSAFSTIFADDELDVSLDTLKLNDW
jgi:hypothetical protein